MHRTVENPVCIVKDMLGPIAVMDIPVDDCHPGDPQEGPCCGNCSIVQETKSHPVHGSGMVPGGPHEGKGRPAGEGFLCGGDGCTGSTHVRHPTNLRCHIGISVKVCNCSQGGIGC